MQPHCASLDTGKFAKANMKRCNIKLYQSECNFPSNCLNIMHNTNVDVVPNNNQAMMRPNFRSLKSFSSVPKLIWARFNLTRHQVRQVELLVCCEEWVMFRDLSTLTSSRACDSQKAHLRCISCHLTKSRVNQPTQKGQYDCLAK